MIWQLSLLRRLTNAPSPLPLLHQVDKLLAELTELTTQYCYCHEYYNADKGMLACDTCNEWFHFECVGVSPPKDNDPATAAEFHCPSCLIKEGKEVPGLAGLPEVTRRALEALKAQPQEPPVANGADEEMPQAPAVAAESNAAPLPEPVAAEVPQSQVAAATPQQQQATAPAEAPGKAVEVLLPMPFSLVLFLSTLLSVSVPLVASSSPELLLMVVLLLQFQVASTDVAMPDVQPPAPAEEAVPSQPLVPGAVAVKTTSGPPAVAEAPSTAAAAAVAVPAAQVAPSDATPQPLAQAQPQAVTWVDEPADAAAVPSPSPVSAAAPAPVPQAAPAVPQPSAPAQPSAAVAEPPVAPVQCPLPTPVAPAPPPPPVETIPQPSAPAQPSTTAQEPSAVPSPAPSAPKAAAALQTQIPQDPIPMVSSSALIALVFSLVA